MVLLAGLLVFALGDRCGSEQHDHAGGDDKPAPQATEPDPCSAAARYAFVDHLRVKRQVGHQGEEHGHGGDTGHKGPTVASRTFSLPAGLPVCIELVNGRGERPWWSRSSAAEITLDGSPIFFRHELNKRVGKLLARRNLSAGDHTLTVRLWSKPGSFVDVSVFTSAPVITSVDPLSGHTGTTVTIQGVNLLVGTTTATFGRSTAAQPVSGTLDTVTVTVPAAATIGPITITNALGTATSPRPFVPLDPDIQDLPVFPLEAHPVTSGGFTEVDLVGDALTLAVSAQTSAPIPAGSTAHLYIDLDCDLVDGAGPGRFEHDLALTAAGVQSGPAGADGAMSSDRVVFTVPLASLPVPASETNGTFFWFVSLDTPTETIRWPLGAGPSQRGTESAATAVPRYLWGQVVVHSATLAGVASAASALGGTIVDVLDTTDLSSGVGAVVELPAGVALANAIGAQGTGADFIAPNFVEPLRESPVGASGCPTDPSTNEVYDSLTQYALNLENVRSLRKSHYAQQLTMGTVPPSAPGATGAPETVFVMDTGVDGTHPEFRTASGGSRVLPMFDAFSQTMITPAVDPEGHGTEAAGVIGAGLNGFGTVGVAPTVLIRPIKVFCVLCAEPTATFTSEVRAVGFAGSHRADRARIVNFSGGTVVATGDVVGEIGRSPEAHWIESMLAAGNLLLVQAGGNDGDFNNDTPEGSISLSGFFSNVGVKLTVAATDDFGVVSGFSTNGSDIDVAAAGACVDTTEPGGGFDFVDGTSFAAPEVSGIAALLRAYAAQQGVPNLTPGRVHDIIKLSAHPVTGSAIAEGAGLIDAYAALSAFLPGGSGATPTLSPLPWTAAHGQIRDLDISPDGSILFVARDDSPRLQIYSLENHYLEAEQALSQPPRYVVADNDGSRAYVVDSSGLAYVPLPLGPAVPLPVGSASLDIRPEEGIQGQHLYVATGADDGISVLDSSDGPGFGSVVAQGPVQPAEPLLALVVLPREANGTFRVVASLGHGSTIGQITYLVLPPGETTWQTLLAGATCTHCSGLVLSPDHTVIAAADTAAGAVDFFDSATLTLVDSVPMPAGYDAIGLAIREDTSVLDTFAIDPSDELRFFFARFQMGGGPPTQLLGVYPTGELPADAPRSGTLRLSPLHPGLGYGTRLSCALNGPTCEVTEVGGL